MNNIVIVDDNSVNLRMLELVLEQRGLPFISFLSSVKAIHYIRENEVDILITDFNMPVLTGLELIDIAKRLKPKLKVAMVCALRDANLYLREKAKELAVNGFMTYPLESLAFNRFLADLLDVEYEIRCIENCERLCIKLDRILSNKILRCCKQEIKEDKS